MELYEALKIEHTYMIHVTLCDWVFAICLSHPDPKRWKTKHAEATMTTLTVSSPELTHTNTHAQAQMCAKKKYIYTYNDIYIYMYISCLVQELQKLLSSKQPANFSWPKAAKNCDLSGGGKSCAPRPMTTHWHPWQPLARRCGDPAEAVHVAAHPAQHFFATAGLFTSRPRCNGGKG